MNFRRHTSFNVHDTRVVQDESGRLTIEHNTKRRCEIVLNALLRNNAEMSAAELTEYIQNRFSDSYSRNDIHLALEKLKDNNLIRTKGKSRGTKYLPSRDAFARWRELPKNNV